MSAQNDNPAKEQGGCCKKAIEWFDSRLPIFSFLKHSGEYQAPKNLNYLWNLGSIAGICLLVQIITGILLAMHYDPNAKHAFDSVESIMRDVNYGWLLRYTHAVGASMFFVVVYLHILRGLYYGSYKSPREVLWWIGVIILLTMMATAFMGYVLPWGQMSFWGATVITGFFTAFPVVGEAIQTWLLGGFSVDNPTLNRFFALHYLLPFIILGIVVLHVVALHTHGSNNPTGVDVKTKKDTIPFHPYYTVKDFLGFAVFFIVFAYFIFYSPNSLGHPDNYTPANPMVTPPHIVPEWYFLPFYAILRAVPDLYIIDAKLGGVLAMVASIVILMFLPWLDSSKVRSANYRPLYRISFWLFLADCLLLGWIGALPADGYFLEGLLGHETLSNVLVGRLATLYYFGHFLVILPVISRIEKPLPLPNSISEATSKSAGGSLYPVRRE